jgi:hypothetical protein
MVRTIQGIPKIQDNTFFFNESPYIFLRFWIPPKTSSTMMSTFSNGICSRGNFIVDNTNKNILTENLQNFNFYEIWIFLLTNRQIKKKHKVHVL